jgi:hypothetical protein
MAPSVLTVPILAAGSSEGGVLTSPDGAEQAEKRTRTKTNREKRVYFFMFFIIHLEF